ncbi:MAG: hypothetical protein SP4CHLAM5_03710 [Chlamydiia bacterium]|nr:hypothetical protein [Chlamydiia bacterium]MCH9618245.1 hypothetical protein [Chlamydiia bacterium]MCH9624310.1 hypothetical protein [Chlamydiia bacterium]
MDPVDGARGNSPQDVESKGSVTREGTLGNRKVTIVEGKSSSDEKTSAVFTSNQLPVDSLAQVRTTSKGLEDLNVTKDNLLDMTNTLVGSSKKEFDAEGYVSFVKQSSGVVQRAKKFLEDNQQAEQEKEKSYGMVRNFFKRADTYAKSFVKPTRTQQIESNTKKLEKELDTIYQVCMQRIERQIDALKSSGGEVPEREITNRKILVQEAFDLLKAFPKQRVDNDLLLPEIVQDCEKYLGLTHLL